MKYLSKESRAFSWLYRLAEAGPERIVFILPRKRLFLIGLLALLFGLVIFLYPEWFEKQSAILVALGGWGCLLTALVMFFLVLTYSGRLVLDAISRTVQLEFRSPFEHTVWKRPFKEFARIETRQVKDMHGLHNHWNIELVASDDVRLKVGYGLNGSIRKNSRDRLAGLISGLLGIPVKNLSDAGVRQYPASRVTIPGEGYTRNWFMTASLVSARPFTCPMNT